jgi:hypothetical protein
MTSFKQIGVAAVAVTILFIAACDKQGRTQGRQIPPDTAKSLAKLDVEFGKRSKLANEWVDELESRQSVLKQLREIVSSDVAARSTASGGLFLIAMDGMEIGRRALEAEARSNRDAFKILSLVSAGILDGTGYIQLDQNLLAVEEGESKRGANLAGFRQHIDRVDGYLVLSAGASGSSLLSEPLGVAHSAITSQRLHINQIASDYEQGIKPGTKALRRIVDQLPKL